jgi:Flp pilus assembly protein TadB
MNNLKFYVACVGLFIAIIGVCGIDSSQIVGAALILLGAILFIPYLAEERRIRKIEERWKKK